MKWGSEFAERECVPADSDEKARESAERGWFTADSTINFIEKTVIGVITAYIFFIRALTARLRFSMSSSRALPLFCVQLRLAGPSGHKQNTLHGPKAATPDILLMPSGLPARLRFSSLQIRQLIFITGELLIALLHLLLVGNFQAIPAIFKHKIEQVALAVLGLFKN